MSPESLAIGCMGGELAHLQQLHDLVPLHVLVRSDARVLGSVSHGRCKGVLLWENRSSYGRTKGAPPGISRPNYARAVGGTPNAG